MSITKTNSTNSQIRPLSLDELEHVSGGSKTTTTTSTTTTCAPVMLFKR